MNKMHVVADTDLGAFLRAFETRDEAIAFAGELIKLNGTDYADELAVGRQTDDGDFVDVVTGDVLRACIEKGAGRRELIPVSCGSPYSGSGYSESVGAMAAKGYK